VFLSTVVVNKDVYNQLLPVQCCNAAQSCVSAYHALYTVYTRNSKNGCSFRMLTCILHEKLVVSASPSAEVSRCQKAIFGHFRSSEQHADRARLKVGIIVLIVIIVIIVANTFSVPKSPAYSVFARLAENLYPV